jgi:RimJ/RimL family protein N-acetyltransferase
MDPFHLEARLTMHVERLSAVHVQSYRALMLQAYEQSAEAFTSSVTERLAMPMAWWEERVAHKAGTSVVFGALVDGALVGAARLDFETRERTRHKGTLFGMYVSPAVRGQGIGRMLVQAVLTYARSRPDTALIQLALTEGNAAALALYESCGFRRFGIEPRALRVNGEYRSKVHMWCDLAALPTDDAA